MKKTIFLTLILTLLLAACGGNAETAPSTDNAEAAQGGENGEGFDIGSRELPISSALAIGTLKLEETDQAIASDQAADLLPLWQVLNSLTTSDTAAQEEIKAIVEQIQETMTDEQMATIEAMELTREDIITTMQELGIEFGGGEGRPEGSGTGQGPGGGSPPGGGPGGGGGFGGQELSPEQIATVQARRAEGGGGGSRMLAPLVPAVIELLEAKVQ